MKSKYDIARLHKDCLAWCESPTWKPWMVDNGLTLKFEGGAHEIVKGHMLSAILLHKDDSYFDFRLKEFAHFIGLDVESYRLPEIDRDQAVRDYLAGIEEGGELVDGWVKKTVSNGNIHAVKGKDECIVLFNDSADAFAYTFLRLDLKEVDNG